LQAAPSVLVARPSLTAASAGAGLREQTQDLIRAVELKVDRAVLSLAIEQARQPAGAT